jgi:hypothetical protein
MYRPSGAVNDRTPYPTVSTVGYVVTSLRDLEQNKSRTPRNNSGRNFLLDKLLIRIGPTSRKRQLDEEPKTTHLCLPGRTKV